MPTRNCHTVPNADANNSDTNTHHHLPSNDSPMQCCNPPQRIRPWSLHELLDHSYTNNLLSHDNNQASIDPLCSLEFSRDNKLRPLHAHANLDATIISPPPREPDLCNATGMTSFPDTHNVVRTIRFA